jgi:hypothetical protein
MAAEINKILKMTNVSGKISVPVIRIWYDVADTERTNNFYPDERADS